MGHLIFPILVLVIVTISKALASSRNQEGNPPARPGAPRPSAESDAERTRRFMEAVGLPTGSTPPPAINPRKAAEPAPLLPVSPPAVLRPGTPGRLRRVPPVIPSPAAQRARPPARSTPPPAPVLQTPVEIPSPLFKSTPAPPPAPKPYFTSIPTSKAAALLVKLRDPSSIRDAIILREVLGPPKALL